MRRHRPYRHHNPLKKVVYFLLFIALCFGVYDYTRKQKFDDDKINQSSLLKERTFDKSVEEIKTNSDVTIWMIEDHAIPIVSLYLIFERSGAAYDPGDKLGLSMISAGMMPLRTARYTRKDFADLLELNGIQIGMHYDSDDFKVSLITPKEHLDTAVSALSDAFFNPEFDLDDLNLLKVQVLESLKLSKEHPNYHLARAFSKGLYGDHPYARDLQGTKEGIENIQTEDLKNFIKGNLARNNLFVGLAGDITPQEALSVLEPFFAKLPPENQQKELPAPVLNLASGTEHIDYPAPQIVSTFASHGVKRLDKDFYPLYIANHIFGGSGLSSRLSLEIREKRGLTYGIYTGLSTHKNAPLILGGFSTSPQNLKATLDALRTQWQNFALYGVSEEELTAAKNYLLASFNLRFASTAGLADMLSYMQKYDLGVDFLSKRNDYVKKVTLQEVNAAAANYFSKLPKLISIGKLENNMEQ